MKTNKKDAVWLVVYVSEHDRENEKISEISLNASKDVILSNISDIVEELENDVIFLRDNICELKKIEVILNGRSRVKFGYSTKVFKASKQFTDIIKKTIKNCNVSEK